MPTNQPQPINRSTASERCVSPEGASDWSSSLVVSGSASRLASWFAGIGIGVATLAACFEQKGSAQELRAPVPSEVDTTRDYTALDRVLIVHSATLRAWNLPDDHAKAPTSRQIESFKQDLRLALRLPNETPLFIQLGDVERFGKARLSLSLTEDISAKNTFLEARVNDDNVNIILDDVISDTRLRLIRNLKERIVTERDLRDEKRQKLIEPIFDAKNPVVKKFNMVRSISLDPALDHVVEVHQLLEKHGESGHARDLLDSSARILSAMRVARYLDTARLPVNEKNVAKGIAALRELSGRYLDAPLWSGRAVVVLCNNETFAEAEAVTGKAMTPQSAIEMASQWKGEWAFYSSPDLRESIKEAVGPKGSVTFVRATEARGPVLMYLSAAACSELLKERERTFDSTSSRTLAACKSELMAYLGHRADSGVELKARTDPDNRTVAFVLGSRDRTIATFQVVMDRDGKTPQSCRVDRCVGAKADMSPKDVKREVLRLIRELPPGPTGFMFVHNGHGNSRCLSITGGSARFVDGETKIELTPEEMSISPEELDAAFMDRAKAFPAKPGQCDISVAASCRSGTFINRQAEDLQRRGNVHPLVLMSQGEVDVLTFDPIGGSGIGGYMWMMLGFDRKMERDAPTSIGDIQKRLRQPPAPRGSTPRILVPDLNRKEGPVFFQISGLPRRRDDDAST